MNRFYDFLIEQTGNDTMSIISLITFVLFSIFVTSIISRSTVSRPKTVGSISFILMLGFGTLAYDFYNYDWNQPKITGYTITLDNNSTYPSELSQMKGIRIEHPISVSVEKIYSRSGLIKTSLSIVK